MLNWPHQSFWKANQSEPNYFEPLQHPKDKIICVLLRWTISRDTVSVSWERCRRTSEFVELVSEIHLSKKWQWSCTSKAWPWQVERQRDMLKQLVFTIWSNNRAEKKRSFPSSMYTRTNPIRHPRNLLRRMYAEPANRKTLGSVSSGATHSSGSRTGPAVAVYNRCMGTRAAEKTNGALDMPKPCTPFCLCYLIVL